MSKIGLTRDIMDPIIINTNGRGFWSDKAKPVTVIGFEANGLINKEDNNRWGELRVKFDPLSWDTYEDGLIYTDDGFIEELSSYFLELGLPKGGIGYSEQGMQGKDYVSLDASGEFLDSLEKVLGITVDWQVLDFNEEIEVDD